MKSLSGHVSNRNFGCAKRLAQDGRVVVTVRRRPVHALVGIDLLRQLSGQGSGITDALASETRMASVGGARTNSTRCLGQSKRATASA